MPPFPLVTSSWLMPFVRTLEPEGAPIDRMLEQARVPRTAREQGELVIAEAPLWAFVELASNEGSMPGLGFRAARTCGVHALGGFTLAIDRAPSLARVVELFASTSPISDYRLLERNGKIYFSRRGSGINIGAWPVEQYVLMLMIQAVQRFAGRDWRPAEVLLQTRWLHGIEESRYLENAVIHAGRPTTAISIPHRLLAEGPSSESFATSSGSTQDWQPTLSRLLEPYVADTCPDEQFAAEILDMSVRTLRRRLNEAGTTYRAILASARFNVARRLLGDRDMRLIDVAQSLGYRDPGSFSRAFRAWSGLSPSAYRYQLKGNDK